jgi:hypothetical protein
MIHCHCDKLVIQIQTEPSLSDSELELSNWTWWNYQATGSDTLRLSVLASASSLLAPSLWVVAQGKHGSGMTQHVS